MKVLICCIVFLALAYFFWSVVRWIFIVGGIFLAIVSILGYLADKPPKTAKNKNGALLPDSKERPLYEPKQFNQETISSLKNPNELQLVMDANNTYCLQKNLPISFPNTIGLLKLETVTKGGIIRDMTIESLSNSLELQEELESLETSDLIMEVQGALHNSKVEPVLEEIWTLRESLLEEKVDIPKLIDEHLRKLLLQFADLQRQDKRTVREEELISTITKGLDVVQEALENLYDRHINRKALEIESEIEAMEMKLRVDGLLDSDFEYETSSKTI